MDVFRVRLNCIDHYQATPTRYDPQLRKDSHLGETGKQPKVPVIRVFGSTETGQKVCAHIHGAFPYLYVEYHGPLDKKTVSEYILRFHLSIDRALAVSYRRDQYREAQNFVARITLVKGVPFYGFYVGYRFYLKIYMFNPVVMTRLADLLQQGLIMGKKFQPYEAHLQYLLQFMTDYNLYGCDYLDVENTKFRAPVPDPAGFDEPPRIWDSNTIHPAAITYELSLPRVSHCSIEADICVQNILNRKDVKERPLHHDFIEREHPLPPDLKLVHSMAGLWRDETKRRKKRMGKSSPGDSPFPQEVMVLMSADLRHSQPPGWIHEEDNRAQLQHLIAQEGKQDGADFTFSNYVESDPTEDAVKTTIQSVEDLFPENLLPALGLEQMLLQEHSEAASSIQIDEKGILEFEVSEEEQQLFPDDLDKGRDRKGKAADGAIVAPKEPTTDKPKSASAGITPASQPQKSAIKGSGAKSQGIPTLNFPVVKDAHDPATVLRLTQRSASQRSDGGTLGGATKKQASFGPVVSVQEVDTLTSTTPPSASKSLNRGARLRWDGSTRMFCLNSTPPSVREVCSTMQSYGLPDVVYQDAFYSKDDDVPPRPREYAGREYRIDGNTLPYLPDFDPTGQSPATFGMKRDQGPDLAEMELASEAQQTQCTLRSWEIAELPPTFAEVSNWWAKKQKKETRKARYAPSSSATHRQKTAVSQLVGPTPKNTHGFKYSQKRKSTSVQHEAQYMSTMSLEIHVTSRGKLVPNPEEDEVQCIFWCLRSDEQALFGTQSDDDTISGIIALSEDGYLAHQIRNQTSAEVVAEVSELDLFVRMVETVRAHDPDILTGYEVHGSSWGYLVERAMHKYEYDLCSEFSRMKSDSVGKTSKDSDRWGFKTTSTLHVTGRHVINVWRAMRGELNLLQYSMENVVWHLLHRRIPHYTWRNLTDWFLSGRPRDLSKVLRYYLGRTRMDIEILEANELIPRTSEQARLLGVDFFSVFSRGSQFKVESIMFRIAKPENFLLVSPSRKQVGAQNALECLPLVMEPQSAFYTSPLLVLDFQSLYPSVMIAYNYCYSTCLGRVVSWRGTNKMGFTEYQRREGLLKLLKDYINISPNGMMYVKPEIRKSLLAKMLTEILETRVMVKSGMKEDKEDKTLQQLLNNRQLALKLLANVTYGYTSASFSGRMPCSEIADSIVQTGRETLERAIAYIHSVERWNAEVVYGDTDSLFVYLKGRTRDQAFDIGAEIAKKITDMNPRPVKLKFEKVYHPCVLLAKKRYVGYKYESRDQVVPEFDAKGIETVRRDGTPAEQKIEEKALKILFETADLSQVKEYFQSQCSKIMRGSVSIGDFCFGKEVKLGTYSNKGPGPPGALISTKRMLEDARAEPQYGERVPYVVISGAPGARLIDRCVAPEDLLNNPLASLDAEYYISKNLIPPLERIFNLVGANVRAWYDEMPKVQQVRRLDTTSAPLAGNNNNNNTTTANTTVDNNKKTLEFFMNSSSCFACGVKMSKPPLETDPDPIDLLPLCARCVSSPPSTILLLQSRLSTEQRCYADVVKICQGCARFAPLEEVPCDSKDCPVFYTRVKQRARVGVDSAVAALLAEETKSS
ncbi:DNA polymerase zeta [Collariella sp. IMI 366227]|nr:DNA polymerase zeta [Collariella sp. IMI 366227]